jgi:hypothetical protein
MDKDDRLATALIVILEFETVDGSYLRVDLSGKDVSCPLACCKSNAAHSLAISRSDAPTTWERSWTSLGERSEA